MKVLMCLLVCLLAVPVCADDTPVSTESRMVMAINKYRARHSLPPLTADPILMRVARHRVKVFNHHAYGRWSEEEAQQAGFHGTVTDNLARGPVSPETIVGDNHSGWGDEHAVGHDMQMKGYTNINKQWVNQHFDLVGVAHEGQNWIAVFGKQGGQTWVAGSKLVGSGGPGNESTSSTRSDSSASSTHQTGYGSSEAASGHGSSGYSSDMNGGFQNHTHQMTGRKHTGRRFSRHR